MPSSILWAHSRTRIPLFLVVRDLELLVLLRQILYVLLQILVLFLYFLLLDNRSFLLLLALADFLGLGVPRVEQGTEGPEALLDIPLRGGFHVAEHWHLVHGHPLFDSFDILINVLVLLVNDVFSLSYADDLC